MSEYIDTTDMAQTIDNLSNNYQEVNSAVVAEDNPTLEVTSTPEVPQKAIDLMMDASNLVAKTVFLKTRFGAIGNSRKVSGSDVLETDADLALLKVSKQLLDSPELEAIKKADGKMRAWLYNTCLPYDMGIQLLPIGLIETAQAKMTEYRTERATLVDAFIASYDAQRQNAAKHLGTLYNEADYPSVDAIKAKFVFEWQYVSFGVPGHLKSISAALFEAEKEKQAQQMQAATEEITAIMRQSLYDMVEHLQARLTPGDDGRPRILRESAVANLQEFLTTFELRNVTNDKELAAQVAKARALLSGTNATAIRNSDILKAKILSGMDSIKDSLSAMVVEKPGRLFRDEDEEPVKIPPAPSQDYKVAAANYVENAA